MTETTHLTETLHDWSQEVVVPHDLAGRALAGRRQARRRRAVPLMAGLATAAAVAVAVTTAGSWGPLGDAARQAVPALQDDDVAVSADTANNPPRDLVAAGDLAVSAVIVSDRVPVGTDGWQTIRRHYALLDPTSRRYEQTDWSYVSVAPGLETAAVLEGDLPASRIGVLDLASGEVTRWIPTDHPVAALAWSPDGSRVLATAYDGDPDLEKPTGDNSYRMGEAARTGFVLVDPGAGTASFTALPNPEMNVGRADVGWTPDADGVWNPSGAPDELFFDLEGRPVSGALHREDLNSNLGVDAATMPIISPDGRFSITRDSGLPTAITDNDTGQVYRQPALQVLGWADDEHVMTLAGCSSPCEGTNEFKNGLVLMRYDGTDPVPLTGTRKGEDGDWYFELTPR